MLRDCQLSQSLRKYVQQTRSWALIALVYTVQVYIWESSKESSDSEMPHDSSEEEVWEEKVVSSVDNGDSGGPG